MMVPGPTSSHERTAVCKSSRAESWVRLQRVIQNGSVENGISFPTVGNGFPRWEMISHGGKCFCLLMVAWAWVAI